MNVSRHLYAIAGLATVLTAASFGSPHTRAVALRAPTSNVVVTNTSGNPVPTSAQGTTQVAGTVAISGTPSVQLSGVPSVTITNDSSSPLPVTSVDVAARTPVDAFNTLTYPDGQIGGGNRVYQVPFGKRLVLQSLSIWATLGSGEGLAQCTLDRSDDVNPMSFPVFMQHQGKDFGGNEHFVGSITGPIYFNGGASVSGSYLRDSGVGTITVNLSMTGYLENAP
jgi:hypothetical protein